MRARAAPNRFVFGHPASGQTHGVLRPVYRRGPPTPASSGRTTRAAKGAAKRAPSPTVTFEERGGETLFALHDLHPSKEALDEAIACGSNAGGFGETFEQTGHASLRGDFNDQR